MATVSLSFKLKLYSSVVSLLRERMMITSNWKLNQLNHGETLRTDQCYFFGRYICYQRFRAEERANCLISIEFSHTKYSPPSWRRAIVCRPSQLASRQSAGQSIRQAVYRALWLSLINHANNMIASCGGGYNFLLPKPFGSLPCLRT